MTGGETSRFVLEGPDRAPFPVGAFLSSGDRDKIVMP